MVNAIQLELKSINKSEKRTPAGMTEITYTFGLKGVNTGGTVEAKLKLEAGDIKELESLVGSQPGTNVVIEIRKV